MFYNNSYWGMNLIWWFIWCALIFWIFATPYDVHGQRRRRDTPHDILKKRFADGEITEEEYRQKKKVLEEGSEEKKEP